MHQTKSFGGHTLGFLIVCLAVLKVLSCVYKIELRTASADKRRFSPVKNYYLLLEECQLSPFSITYQYPPNFENAIGTHGSHDAYRENLRYDYDNESMI